MVVQRVLTLATMVGLMAVLRQVMDLAPGDTAADTTVILGFLLLAAFIAGQLFRALGLPRITGYILLGLLVGPGLVGIVTDENIADLRLVDDVAISLIALSAGGELKLEELRRRARSMLGIMSFEMAAVFLVIAGGVLALGGLLPFTAGKDLATVATIALIFGSIAIANSPSVAIAVINESRARGPVSSTVLGVTVMKDVAVILLFAVSISVARSILKDAGGFDLAFFGTLAWEIGGSLLIGAVSGAVISVYLRTTNEHIVLFTLGIAFLNAYVAHALHLEVLLLSLSAGFFVENISPVHGEPFVDGLERNSLPLYALFFSLAGASIHLDELRTLWPFVLGFVAARAAAIFGGTWLGARVTGSEPEVRRYAWLGFVSQAGVTLGMVVIAARAFPEWGDELRTLFVGMVAIHELIGPVALQYGLKAAGEVGRKDAEVEEVEGVTAGVG